MAIEVDAICNYFMCKCNKELLSSTTDTVYTVRLLIYNKLFRVIFDNISMTGFYDDLKLSITK